MGKEITCKNCGWQWNTSDSEDYDKYVCHKCGFDNRTFYDSEPIGVAYLKGGRTISQTPAPKKDRIFGSKVNPKGSASSEKSASKIVLSEKIIDSLKKKLAENNNKKVSLNDLKAVYRRGLGAYSTSYRPTISGGRPNSRNAWAMARVNKFLEKAAGKKVKAAYVQDDDLLNYENGGLIKNKQFYNWYLDWYKNDVEGMTIMFTLPSEFTRLSNTSENDIILDVFQKNENVNAKIYLQQIVDNADKYGITIYLHPIPRTHRLMSEEHKSKITTDYLISYFEKFDFVIDADRFFMVRKSKVNYEQGGKVEDMTIQELNIEYIRLNKKFLKEQKIQRKFADEKNWVLHDIQSEVLEFINDRMGEVSTVLEIKEDEAKKNKSKRYNGGGEVTDCKEYIMQNKSLFANGYFFDMQKLSEINDPYGQVPKNLNFTLIAYNSGGQNNLGVIDTINPTILSDKLGQLCNLSKSQSYIVIQYFIDNAERLNDIKQIKTEKMVIVDRDNIVCENLSYANGGEITNACIEEVINIINSIQKVKDYYIHDGKLVIVFVEDLMVYGIDMINYHIGQFEECHDVIEPEAIVNDKENYKSIYFILKKDDATIGQFKEGGEVESNTEKLISEIKKYSNITEGIVSTATDGSQYRYDKYVLKFPSTANWLVNLFEKAAQENNKKNATQFSYEDKYSISYQRPTFKGEPNGKIIMNELIELGWQFKEGGEVENKETYAKWKSLVNMSSSELERFYNSEEGKKAGLTPQQAKNKGIDSGRESARMILKMKDIKVSDWTPNMWRWAKKQISFISRMSGVKGSLYDEKGNKTRKHLALLIWGNNPEKKNNGGEINNHKNTNNMESFKFNGLPHIDTISDNDLILIKEEVFVGDIDKPMHKGTRYVSCKVMSKGGMVDSLNLKVIKSVGANALSIGQTITRPIANLVSNGRKIINSYKDGGELNPDNKVVKQYFAHDSGNAGGVLVGKRHSQGGIKATNNSTGQPIEMEGGEVVITRGAVSNPKKYSFEGKEMTTKEVLSKLNVDGGGISFADGGDVPEKMNCGCSTMKLGGETMSTQDFITMSENEYQDIRLREGIQKEKKDHYSTLSKLNSGAITIEDAFREIAQKKMSLDSKYPFAE